MPELFGVDDSDELEEPLQEDGQAEIIEQICRLKNDSQVLEALEEWFLSAGGKPDGYEEFSNKIAKMVKAVRDAG